MGKSFTAKASKNLIKTKVTHGISFVEDIRLPVYNLGSIMSQLPFLSEQNHQTETQHSSEVSHGRRFEFGKNWNRFLALLNEDRITQAEKSLQTFLEVADLRGKRFLDIGSGSGLFSLAARRLGASVYSFDYDPQSVACTQELKRRYFADDADWRIEEGSALDETYLKTLGQFDIIYSWGVLHHTGDMWQALENVVPLVASAGILYIAIYNDQGSASQRWATVKKAYNRLPKALKFLVLGPAFLRLWGLTLFHDMLRGKPLASWQNYDGLRGMSPWHDVVDWTGGYPFEVASPEAIFQFFRRKNFRLQQMRTTYGLGCNEYLFVRDLIFL